MAAFLIFLTGWAGIIITIDSSMSETLKAIFISGLFIGVMFTIPLALIFEEYNKNNIVNIQVVFALLGLMFGAVAARLSCLLYTSPSPRD